MCPPHPPAHPPKKISRESAFRYLPAQSFFPPCMTELTTTWIFLYLGGFLLAFVCKVYFCTHSLTHTRLFRFDFSKCKPHLSGPLQTGPFRSGSGEEATLAVPHLCLHSALKLVPLRACATASVHESLFALAFNLLMAQCAAVSRRIVPP